jgi:hypothetical protein
MLNECIPFYEAAYTQKITVHFDTAGTGCRFCGPLKGRQSGPGLAADPLAAGDGGNFKVDGTPAAGGQVGGVIMGDVASGAKGGIIRGAGTILPIESGAAITLGQEVQADASGRVIPLAAGRAVGLAHEAAGGAGTKIQVELYAGGFLS